MESQGVPPPFHRWLRSLKVEEPTVRETMEIYLNCIEELEAKLRHMDERIVEIAAGERYAERTGKLRCFKGIESLISLALICEIGDFRRFATAEQFMGFLGMVPSEHSSGQTRRQGSITKTGNSHLRRLLIEAAWHYRSPTVRRARGFPRGEEGRLWQTSLTLIGRAGDCRRSSTA